MYHGVRSASLPTLREAHHRHHAFVGRDGDPDMVTSGTPVYCTNFVDLSFHIYRFARSRPCLLCPGFFYISGLRLEYAFALVVPSLGSAVQLMLWAPGYRTAPTRFVRHPPRTKFGFVHVLVADCVLGYHVEHHSFPRSVGDCLRRVEWKAQKAS